MVCEQEPERPSTVIARTETRTLAAGTTETTTPLSVSATRDGSPDALRNRLSGAIDAIVLKALRKTPEARYATVAALADDVRRSLEEKPVSAGRDAFRYRTTRVLQRHRSALGVAALILAAVAITAVAASRWTAASRRSASAAALTGSTVVGAPPVGRRGRVHQPVRPDRGSMALDRHGGDAHVGVGGQWPDPCRAGRPGRSGDAGPGSRHHRPASRGRDRAPAPPARDRLPGAGFLCHQRERRVTSAPHRRPRAQNV